MAWALAQGISAHSTPQYLRTCVSANQRNSGLITDDYHAYHTRPASFEKKAAVILSRGGGQDCEPTATSAHRPLPEVSLAEGAFCCCATWLPSCFMRLNLCESKAAMINPWSPQTAIIDRPHPGSVPLKCPMRFNLGAQSRSLCTD